MAMRFGLLSDSEDELEMDFISSPSVLSESSSSCTLDSGLSSNRQTGSDISLSPFDDGHNEDYIVNPSNFAFQFDFQQFFVHQAIHCLLMPDDECVVNASAYLFQLCKSGFSAALLQAGPEIISNIFPVVCVSCKNLQVIHFLSGIMHYLSHTPDGVDFILNSNGVNLLAHFLASPVESVLYYTVTTIHNILLVRKPSREVIQQSMVVNHLVRLLNFSVNVNSTLETKVKMKSKLQNNEINPKFITILCDCLHILAYGHEATKKTFLDESGISSLLSLIMYSGYEKVLWTSTRLLRVLSAWMPAKLEILTQDPACSFFTHCVSKGSIRLTANVLWTLRNLSDIAIDKLDCVVIASIVEQVHSQLHGILDTIQSSSSVSELKDQFSVARCILGILGNLTCGNNATKSQLLKLNGVDVITRVMLSVLNSQQKRSALQRPSTMGQNNTTSPVRSADSALSDSFSTLSLRVRTPSGDRSSSTAVSRPIPIPNSSPTRSNYMIHTTELASQSDFPHVPPFVVAPDTGIGPEHKPTSFVTRRSSDPVTTESLYRNRQSRATPSPSSSSRANSPLIHIPSASLSSILDLLEAGFRCLSHLTAGHPEASKAVTYFYQQRPSSHLMGLVATHLLLPLLSNAPCQTSSDLYSNPTWSNYHQQPQHLAQTLQLIRAWATLANNLCALASSVPRSSPYQRGRLRHRGNKCAYTQLPKSLVPQLRRSVRPLDHCLNRLAELMPSDRPRELVTAQNLVHRLLDKLPSSSSIDVAQSECGS